MKSTNTSPWSRLAQSIVREIRGNRSQNELNNAFGLGFNQVHRWETGRKRILWREFARLCEICEIPLEAVCKNILRLQSAVYQSDLFLQNLITQDDIEAFSKRYGIGNQIVRRWRAGVSELTLEGALQALEFRMHSVVPLLGNLLDISKLTELKHINETESARRELFYSHPAFAILLTTLHLDEVRNAPNHSIEFLKRFITIDSSYLRILLNLGVEKGILKNVGGRYECPNLAFSLRANSERVLDFYQYWTERALQVQNDLQSESTEDFFPTFIVTTSPNSRRKINEAISVFRTTIANATRTDDPVDRMTVIQVSCFTPLELPPPIH